MQYRQYLHIHNYTNIYHLNVSASWQGNAIFPFKPYLRKTIHMLIEDISFVHVDQKALQAADSPRNCPNPPLLLSHLRVICGGVVRCWQLLSQRAVGLTSSQLHQVQIALPGIGQQKIGEKQITLW